MIPKLRRKLYMTLGVIIAIFVITNPSMKSFEEHQGTEHREFLARETNYFVCSIYHDYRHTERYLAILGNFFEL